MPARAQDLKDAGLKATLPRMKVLDLFQNSKVRHMTAEDVYRLLMDEGLDVGLATIYRVLTQFEQAGLLKRHHFEGGKSIFELNEGDKHDHIVCVNTRNGKPYWKFPFCKNGVNPSVVLHGGDKLIAIHNDENIDSTEKGRMIALKLPAKLTAPVPPATEWATLEPAAELWRCPIGATGPTLPEGGAACSSTCGGTMAPAVGTSAAGTTAAEAAKATVRTEIPRRMATISG